MPKSKRPSSKEQLEEQGWHREERRAEWTQGRGSQFDACIARLAHHPADPAFFKHLIALAWTPEYAAILRGILEEAQRDPGSEGFGRAREAARQVWNHICTEPRNVGGRPQRVNLNACILYTAMFEDAKKADPMAKVNDIQRAVVKKHGQVFESTKVRDLKEMLRRARQRYDWFEPTFGSRLGRETGT
jgi:hypothetical protein